MGRTKRTGNPNHAIAALAGRQQGVVSRSQLRALGLTDGAITARAASGYLQPLFHGTFAVGHRAIRRQAQLFAAVLACGDGTVLSHGSAAELIGLWDAQPAAVDVIPPNWSGRKIEGIRWHRVLLPTPEEIEVRDGIPCTSPARTLVDMAGRLGCTSQRRLVERAAVLRLLNVTEVDRVLSRGRRRGAPQLRLILTAWRSKERDPPRLRSVLEARILQLLVEEDLPRPRCNVAMQIDGHRLEVDLLWEEQRLAVETDGEETHGTRAAFQRDRWRDQLLVAAGFRTVRVTWRQLENEPGSVIGRIRRMLDSGQNAPVRLL